MLERKKKKIKWPKPDERLKASPTSCLTLGKSLHFCLSFPSGVSSHQVNCSLETS